MVYKSSYSISTKNLECQYNIENYSYNDITNYKNVSYFKTNLVDVESIKYDNKSKNNYISNDNKNAFYKNKYHRDRKNIF